MSAAFKLVPETEELSQKPPLGEKRPKPRLVWDNPKLTDRTQKGKSEVKPDSSYSRVLYNYFRYYDPSTGRYITSDPYGLYGGLSTYVYVNANPLNWVDPAGLRPATPTEMFGPQPVNILDGPTPPDPGLLKDWERLKNVAQTAAGLVGATKAAQACGKLISRNKDRLLNLCKQGFLAGSIFCSKPGIDRDIESGPIRDVGRQRMEMEQLKRDSGTNRQQTINGNR